MEIEELRLGNYVQYERNSFHIAVESIELVNNLVNATDIEYLEPISLTEEWLLKLGGKKIPHFTVTNSIIIKTKRNQQLSFSCVGTPNFMVFLQEIDPDNENKITDLIPIHNWDYDKDMYVHQFQNIYFALNGEELTVK
ncbi:hypothetical protein KRE43_12755 [Elizabethkingia meningoseptica]|uniref:hypothetical protein n=1 Tax=Elizabethkingia meningoseptica TaxID=238 RepID=UPI0023B1A64C|nr:hypothetical protein [Elizabethkingia meningoseptica]MDE5530452.1 hypothetical protein [Elizabethkingia meningoseptica]MDE5534009.1 hypothetical protein [Elizabethkingia meningoseptica]MDE5542715.1 hypothetical protein [Elizabethkingia meningoseptica]